MSASCTTPTPDVFCNVMQILAPCAKSINFNTQILNLYLDELMPGITEDADDNNYGSAAMQDVLCLQALSKRIHYGKFVAEAKFRANPEQYQALIRKSDQDAIMQLLTNESVERKVYSQRMHASLLCLPVLVMCAPVSEFFSIPQDSTPLQ